MRCCCSSILHYSYCRPCFCLPLRIRHTARSRYMQRARSQQPKTCAKDQPLHANLRPVSRFDGKRTGIIRASPFRSARTTRLADHAGGTTTRVKIGSCSGTARRSSKIQSRHSGQNNLEHDREMLRRRRMRHTAVDVDGIGDIATIERRRENHVIENRIGIIQTDSGRRLFPGISAR